jgi:hypothetical protein
MNDGNVDKCCEGDDAKHKGLSMEWIRLLLSLPMVALQVVITSVFSQTARHINILGKLEIFWPSGRV